MGNPFVGVSRLIVTVIPSDILVAERLREQFTPKPGKVNWNSPFAMAVKRITGASFVMTGWGYFAVYFENRVIMYDVGKPKQHELYERAWEAGVQVYPRQFVGWKASERERYPDEEPENTVRGDHAPIRHTPIRGY